jgi:hypothetical protein
VISFFAWRLGLTYNSSLLGVVASQFLNDIERILMFATPSFRRGLIQVEISLASMFSLQNINIFYLSLIYLAGISIGCLGSDRCLDVLF